MQGVGGVPDHVPSAGLERGLLLSKGGGLLSDAGPG